MMRNSTAAKTDKNLSNLIKINETQIDSHLGEMVRSAVEETLNEMLDAEAHRLCKVGRYERTGARTDGGAGRHKRKLHAKAREVELEVPKLRKATFETAIIERCKRRESSVEEALMEMYLVGVSVRRVAGIPQALWGMRVGASTVSDLNQRLYQRIEARRNRRIKGGISVRVPRRHQPQMHVGRRSAERLAPVGNRRWRGRLS